MIFQKDVSVRLNFANFDIHTKIKSRMFTKDDLKQLQSRGSDPKVVELQIENFRKGFPYINLDRPAIVGDGIKAFNQRDAKKLSYYYDSNSKRYDVL